MLCVPPRLSERRVLFPLWNDVCLGPPRTKLQRSSTMKSGCVKMAASYRCTLRCVYQSQIRRFQRLTYNTRYFCQLCTANTAREVWAGVYSGSCISRIGKWVLTAQLNIAFNSTCVIHWRQVHDMSTPSWSQWENWGQQLSPQAVSSFFANSSDCSSSQVWKFSSSAAIHY